MTTHSPTPQPADDEIREDEDFLAFWRQHRAKTAKESKVILGVLVPVPNELPLALEDMLNELKDVDVEDDEQVAPLLAMLFGQDVYGRWKANGLTTEMLKTLFVWGASNGGGRPMTFEEAAVEAAKWTSESEGKARPVPNRKERRAASSRTNGSVRAGRSSSATSAASTASRRTTSRG
ncbi:hypothetical protein SUDANB95_05521 [Actinosynnema sp. ALI-1.44]